MRIKEITFQLRNDFSAILLCEHCAHEQDLKTGYDDDNYHTNVLPLIMCLQCGFSTADPAPDEQPGRDAAAGWVEERARWLRQEASNGGALSLRHDAKQCDYIAAQIRAGRSAGSHTLLAKAGA